MDELTDKQYSWETEYEKSWEEIQEGEDGLLSAAASELQFKAKRRKMLELPANIKLGVMRHLFLIVDTSRAMDLQDLKPNRLKCTVELIKKFITDYFDQNPISQLGIITTQNGRTQKLTELSSNCQAHLTVVQNLDTKPCLGEPSLQNSIEMAARALRNVPSHASREILIIFGSLTTCDPGNILETIECSIIGLAAEVNICKTLCHQTEGIYSVVLDEQHFGGLLTQQCRPPAAKVDSEASLIKMGFPQHRMNGLPSLCMCHLNNPDSCKLSNEGYFCPQCNSKYCELPVECKTCGLTLVSAPHLARSYHHLFPLKCFSEVFLTERRNCCGCHVMLENQAYECVTCNQLFCIDCDLFIHEKLHTCPGCTASLTRLEN
ncbi:general transcription factor IIH subunit 2-like protein isoform X2 [Dysidea avara]|uniref:general transcription factor IIH subunit 2-like protein isoform X2 n=1 Tax=Dysidea avara TaxID=196820 RepID=UPI003321AAD0